MVIEAYLFCVSHKSQITMNIYLSILQQYIYNTNIFIDRYLLQLHMKMSYQKQSKDISIQHSEHHLVCGSVVIWTLCDL